MEVRARKRNARGSGNLLRAEILAAAAELLDATGRRSDLTLRQIAGAAGISAPAIYAHFADREAILVALAEQGWQQVVADIRAAADPQAAARERLLCGCRAYLAFAQQHPARYALMTETVGPTPAAREALGLLTRALAACQVDTGAHPRAARIAAALSDFDEVEVDADASTVSVPAPNGVATLTEVFRRMDEIEVELIDISLRRPSLDEVFLHLTTPVTST